MGLTLCMTRLERFFEVFQWVSRRFPLHHIYSIVFTVLHNDYDRSES